MNIAHAHLALNHFPIVMMVLMIPAALALFFSSDLFFRRAVFTLGILVGLFAVAVVWTGQGAEELTEQMAGFSPEMIVAHERAAYHALYVCLGLGFLCASGLIVRAGSYQRFMPGLLLTLALIGTYLCIMAGFTGGSISHPEIQGSNWLHRIEAE